MSTKLHHMPWHIIRRMQQISTAVMQGALGADTIDLTPVQYAVLEALKTAPGLEQARLAGMVANDRTTMGGVVDRLETRGLVRRSADAADGRLRRVHLTEAGEQVLDQARTHVRQCQAQILGGLSDGERRRLLELLAKSANAGNALSRAPLILPEVEELG